jgi:NADH-quinone oxidoreductase subunit K
MCAERGTILMLGPGVSWYLGIAAFLFGIGALGVLLRRNPLIVLLSLEIMLNGSNLALIAFSRHSGNGDGQIFALAVMAVAASEVVVGLGLIVALNRKRLALDVDKLSTLRG